MTKSIGYAAAASAAMVLATLASLPARADSPASDPGLRVFKSANCVGCHKWTGEGGGGYGAAAANLRRTTLDLQQIEDTIRCGRPSTGMPHFDPDAYADGRCYGMKQSDLTKDTAPPAPDHWLRPADIEAVAKYVVAHVKGQGAPTFAQCQAFFGTTTRACDTYPRQGGGNAVQTASSGTAPPGTAPAGTAPVGTAPAGKSPSGPPPSAAPADTGHGRLKIEAAPDANAGK